MKAQRCCFWGRWSDASNEDVPAEPSLAPVVKTTLMNSTDNQHVPTVAKILPSAVTDLGHCRCHASHGQKVAVDPHLCVSHQTSESCCPPICLLCLLTRPSWQLLCKDFSLYFLYILPPHPPPPRASVLVIFAERLHSVSLARSIFRLLYLGVLICPPSPLASRLLRLMISQ